eukprot:scaffold33956_cov29-Tisochrysis_lutea.AAC.6
MVVSGRQPKESCLSNTSSTLCAGSPPASRSLASVRTVVATSTPPGESKKRIGAATSWADGHLSLFTPLGVIPLMPDAGRLPLREELPPTRCLAEAEELPRFGGEASLRSALVAAPLVGRPPASSTAAARSSGTGSVAATRKARALCGQDEVRAPPVGSRRAAASSSREGALHAQESQPRTTLATAWSAPLHWRKCRRRPAGSPRAPLAATTCSMASNLERRAVARPSTTGITARVATRHSVGLRHGVASAQIGPRRGVGGAQRERARRKRMPRSTRPRRAQALGSQPQIGPRLQPLRRTPVFPPR